MIGWHKVRLVVQPCELGNITAKLTSKKVVVLTAYAERLLAKKNFRLTCYIADHPLVRFELGF